MSQTFPDDNPYYPQVRLEVQVDYQLVDDFDHAVTLPPDAAREWRDNLQNLVSYFIERHVVVETHRDAVNADGTVRCTMSMKYARALKETPYRVERDGRGFITGFVKMPSL